MRYLLTSLLCVFTLSLTAQEPLTYPYNPDANSDQFVAVSDVLETIAIYGSDYFPSEIMVDGETLTTVLTNLQNSIDSLYALSDGSAGSVLEMPIGTILPVASPAVSEGWMLCDGREAAITDYQELFDLIGTTFGAGDSAFWAQVNSPATTFNIPDLRGRTIIGADNMGGASAGVVSQHPSWLGKSGGAEMHQLTEDEMPSHSHGYEAGNGTAGTEGTNYIPYVSSTTGLVDKTSETTGGDLPHNNMQPYIALNYMVKVQSGGGSGSSEGEEESVLTVSFPDDDGTPNTISISDYSRFIIVDGPPNYGNYSVYVSDNWTSENNAKFITIVNRTGALMTFENQFNSFGVDTGNARDFVIIDGVSYTTE